jgi:hypothetical protein
MNKTLGFAALALAALGCSAGPEEIGQVLEGTALVRMTGDEVWKVAEIGSVLLEGDSLRTRGGEGITFRVDGAWLGMTENGRIDLGEIDSDGFRKSACVEGDLFLMAESEKSAGFLVRTGAGTILLRRGALILRTDLLSGIGESERAAGMAPPCRVQAGVIAGEAVLENLGRARTLARGERGFLLTGRAPDEPKAIAEDVIADYEFALGQVLHRGVSAKWGRPPLFDPPAFPEAQAPPTRSAGESVTGTSPGEGESGTGEGGKETHDGSTPGGAPSDKPPGSGPDPGKGQPADPGKEQPPAGGSAPPGDGAAKEGTPGR